MRFSLFTLLILTLGSSANASLSCADIFPTSKISREGDHASIDDVSRIIRRSKHFLWNEPLRTSPLSKIDVKRMTEHDPMSFDDFMRLWQGEVFKDQYGNLWNIAGVVTWFLSGARTTEAEAIAKSRFLAELWRIEVTSNLQENAVSLPEEALDSIAFHTRKRMRPLLSSGASFIPGAYDYWPKGSEFWFTLYDIPGILRKNNGHFSNLYNDDSFPGYLKFILDQYQKRLGITSEQRNTLEKISKAVKERTTLIVQWLPISANRSNFLAGVFGVHSKEDSEKLPIELIHDMDIRDILGLPNKTYLIEVGRHVRAQGNNQADPRFPLEMLIAFISGNPKIEYIIVEADSARKRLWGRLGFEAVEIQSQNSGDYYKSGSDYLMFGRVDDVLKSMLPAHEYNSFEDR